MPYKIVRQFEDAIAEYSGAPYAVAVESCSAAIFLSCLYKNIQGQEITIPRHTYPSVPCSIIHAGGKVKFSTGSWEGVYSLYPIGIIDGALRFKKGMYHGGLHCLSFHNKKHLPIGRGGMILTEDFNAQAWLRRARFDGRGEMPLQQDDFRELGWNMYITPEQAARGLLLFSAIKDKDLDDLSVEEQGYPDLSKFEVYSVKR